jgi:hypothetical protein
VCADGWVAITFPGDDDGTTYAKANDTGMVGHIEFANGSCSATANSWEKMELCVDGTCALTGSDQYCLP